MAVAPDEQAELQVVCSECGHKAGSLRLDDGEVVRDSFTSVMTQPVGEAAFETLRGLLGRGDVAGLFAWDPELTPFWCPDCGLSYCGRHWQTTNVFDDETGGLDCIRGTCPHGHSRMLED
jgi:hypothetical protein